MFNRVNLVTTVLGSDIDLFLIDVPVIIDGCSLAVRPGLFWYVCERQYISLVLENPLAVHGVFVSEQHDS